MKNTNKKRLKWIYISVSVAFWLILWQIAATLYDMDFILPSPVTTVKKLLENVQKASFWSAILFSTGRILLGFFLSAVTGILIALVGIKVKALRILFDPFCSVMRAVPVASFIIFVLILFSSENVATVISFLMAFPVVYSGVSGGVDSAPQELLEVSRLFKMGFVKELKYIYFPHLLPFVANALSVSVGLAFKSGIAAEVIGYPVGSVGAEMYISKLGMNMPNLLSYTVVIVIISVLCEKLLKLVCRLPKSARKNARVGEDK